MHPFFHGSRRQHAATLERELAAQRKRLEHEAAHEQGVALQRLEANLRAQHAAETETLTARLARQHTDQADAAQRRALAAQAKQLAEQHAATLKAELKAQREVRVGGLFLQVGVACALTWFSPATRRWASSSARR